jgi:hypothetical protein
LMPAIPQRLHRQINVAFRGQSGPLLISELTNAVRQA